MRFLHSSLALFLACTACGGRAPGTDATDAVAHDASEETGSDDSSGVTSAADAGGDQAHAGDDGSKGDTSASADVSDVYDASLTCPVSIDGLCADASMCPRTWSEAQTATLVCSPYAVAHLQECSGVNMLALVYADYNISYVYDAKTGQLVAQLEFTGGAPPPRPVCLAGPPTFYLPTSCGAWWSPCLDAGGPPADAGPPSD